MTIMINSVLNPILKTTQTISVYIPPEILFWRPLLYDQLIKKGNIRNK